MTTNWHSEGGHDDVEPWEVAAAREHGVRDAIAITILAAAAMAWALVPSARTLAFTGLRLGVAAVLAAAALVTSGMLAQALDFAARAFVLLAVFSVAAHVEGVVLGPFVDRIAGKEPRT